MKLPLGGLNEWVILVELIFLLDKLSIIDRANIDWQELNFRLNEYITNENLRYYR